MTPASPAVSVRPAASGDLDAVLALLSVSALPSAGVADHFPGGFVVAVSPAGEIGAVAGVEVHGDAGLLRSVAVRGEMRGAGAGRAVVEAAISLARDAGVRTLYLLTTTADAWFPRFGFARVERDALPAALDASAELRGACPASAIAMRLALEAA